MLSLRSILVAAALLGVGCSSASSEQAGTDASNGTPEAPPTTPTKAPQTEMVLPPEPPLDRDARMTLDIEADGTALLSFPPSLVEHGTCWVIEQWDGADWTVATFSGYHGATLNFRAVDPSTIDCELTLVTATEVSVELPDLGSAWVRLCLVSSQERPCSSAALVEA